MWRFSISLPLGHPHSIFKGWLCVWSILLCVQAMLWLPIFNLHVDNNYSAPLPSHPPIPTNGVTADESVLTGVMTVRSGRWLPPAMGWLLRMTSPSFRSSPRLRICQQQQLWATQPSLGYVPHICWTFSSLQIIFRGFLHVTRNKLSLFLSMKYFVWLSVCLYMSVPFCILCMHKL